MSPRFHAWCFTRLIQHAPERGADDRGVCCGATIFDLLHFFLLA